MGKISGVIKIGRVTGGIVSFGDTFCISPVSNVKETSGGGSNLVGEWIIANTGYSCTNYIDPDVSNQIQSRSKKKR